MQRDLRLDAIRGFLLAEITFVHTHAPGSSIVNEFFGRVSMAAGFIFLSGLVAGAVYGRMADRSLLNCSNAAVRRAFYIHKYHVATFTFLFLVALLVPQYIDYFRFDWITNPPEAWRNIVKFVFLAYQPGLFDILPLYTLFVLAMPLAFLGFKNGHSTTVLTISLGLWIIAQLGLGNDGAFGGSYFNPFAWQLLYITGLYFGYYQIHHRQEIVRFQRGLIAICFSIVVLGFSLRWNLVEWPDYVQKGTFLSNKSSHSILYLINFYAFVYLVWCVARRLPGLITIRPFVFLGKHSIQVFSFHILVIYLMRPLMRTAREVSPWMGMFLGVLIVGSLFIPAMIHHWYREMDQIKKKPGGTFAHVKPNAASGNKAGAEHGVP
jgi:hypothetical protein